MTPPPSGCPLRDCIGLLAGRWTADVIWYLREGERCFSELQHDLKGVSAKMLTARLRDLEWRGVLERRTHATSPPTVWYALTPVGHDLCTALVRVVDVAQGLRRKEAVVTEAPRSASGDRM